MDVSQPQSGKEHGACSFDDLLSRQRAALLSRIDSLRCSVEKFDKRCRSHLSSRGLSRRRSDGDLTAWGRCSNRTADIATDWSVTSGSDTDESVIEVCATTQKLRQTRGTQTFTTNCSCQTTKLKNIRFSDGEVPVSDAATQTVDGDARIDVFDHLIKEKCVSGELLDVLEVLANQRSPKNGRHRSLVKHTTSSPIDRRSKNGTPWHSDLVNKLQASHSDFKRSERKPYSRRDNKGVSETIDQNPRHLETRQTSYSRRDVKKDGYDCQDHDDDDAHDTANEDDCLQFEDTNFHSEDDLWRLAEEGRLPWSCNLIQTSKTNSHNQVIQDFDNTPSARLLYCNEMDSLFGPVRIFRRCQLKRMYIPPWRWISLPPVLEVIPEY